MNRKTLILSLIVLIIAISIVGAIFYWQSFKAVTYKLRRDDISVTVFKQEGDQKQSIDTIDKETTRQLQRGKYLIVPNGDIYSPAPIEFEVKDADITVEIKPDYSSNYRRTLRGIELPAINEAIKSTYPTIIDNFIITDGEIYMEGDWYATLLIEKTEVASDEGDVYRTVLRKENGKWTVKAKPALVLGSKEYPDIPKDILSSINSKRP